tara:strand:+ start:129 stop:299 length:171 start_codon:yes stop_codon:yes gene_type:complete
LDKKEEKFETEKFLKLIEKEIKETSNQKLKNWINNSYSLSLKKSLSHYFNKINTNK